MTKKKAVKPAASKKKRPNTLNPAEAGLTGAEHEVYEIMRTRQDTNQTITSGDVASKWEKERTYAYRVIKALIDKGYAEQYNTRYYRLLK